MAIINNPKTLDLSDIQGMITRGYAKLFKTYYLSIDITDSTKAKAWLKAILPEIDAADQHTDKEKAATLHIAFASNGLEKLGMNSENLNTFPLPFREGMSTENRNRRLGDFGQNAPEKWRWGAQNDEQIMLIIHATDDQTLQSYLEQKRTQIKENGGIVIRHEMAGYGREDNKEPFGFHDGISQPIINGCGRKGPEMDIIKAGEFLLGYENEHGRYPDSPVIKLAQGDTTLLKDDIRDKQRKDIGRNGTFMVFRQMEQHVDAFWKAMEEHTRNEDGSVNEAAKIKLASKCVGRWPSGASLVNYPDADPGGSHSNDDFGYAEKDPDGLRCPFGSHLRRNNPRDTVRWYNPKQSLKVSRRHRIIRRGRIYELPEHANRPSEIGLQFICFNADIALQFEFIQHTWANNNQTRELSNDPDIIIGVPNEKDPNRSTSKFTVQSTPTNEFYEGWDQYVTIKGGSYYFLPSMTTLNYLTTI